MSHKSVKFSRSYKTRNRFASENGNGAEIYDDGCLHIEHRNYYAECQGTPMRLTRTEFLFLSRLVMGIDEIVTSKALWAYAWGDKPIRPKSVHVFACALRRKLSRLGMRLDNMVKVGYRLSHDKCCDADKALKARR